MIESIHFEELIERTEEAQNADECHGHEFMRCYTVFLYLSSRLYCQEQSSMLLWFNMYTMGEYSTSESKNECHSSEASTFPDIGIVISAPWGST